MLEVVGSSVDFEDVDGVTILGIRRFGLSTSARFVKRAFDVAFATTALLAFAPLIAVIAIAVRLDSPGPILFRQQRVGARRPPLRMLKFRTMVADAEQRKAALADRNETDGFFKITDDPRITRTGRLLRQTSLDEIPQFVNVLRGEMSIVRPASADPRRGRADRRPGPQPAAPDARHDRPVAGARLLADPAERDGQPRLRLRHQLVALARREAPAAARFARARPSR